MVVLDVYNTQSSYKFTPELFRYCNFQVIKDFRFHRKQCKMQIYAHRECFLFHFALRVFVKIVFCAVQNTKGKLPFNKI